MTRKMMIAVLSASLVVALPGGAVVRPRLRRRRLPRRRFRRRRLRGGGSGGGFRGGSGGMSSFSQTPSFSSPGSFERPGGYGGGMSYGSRGAAEGMYGGRIEYGSRSGSYTTARGGTVDYGAAGHGARGPGGAEAGRGVYGIQGTTAGGRSYTDVGRAGGAVGPGGNAVGGRSNIAAASGPAGPPSGVRGASAACGPRRRRGSAAAERRWVSAAAARLAATGPAAGYRPYGYNAYGGVSLGLGPRLLERPQRRGLGLAQPVLGRPGAWASAWGWAGDWRPGASARPSTAWATCPTPTPITATAGPRSWPVSRSMAAPYDYSQPIDTTSAPADDSVTNPAMALFDAGRASFQQGNYADALQQTDDALAKLPNDTTLHEFRALCLFALGRYDEAAATLYAVLSVGPGWDWTTLIGLYPERRRLHHPAPRPRRLLHATTRVGQRPLRARLPLPDRRATPRRPSTSSSRWSR